MKWRKEGVVGWEEVGRGEVGMEEVEWEEVHEVGYREVLFYTCHFQSWGTCALPHSISKRWWVMGVMLQCIWNTSNVHFHVYENLPPYFGCVWCRFVRTVKLL